jgi:hypothetical protein
MDEIAARSTPDPTLISTNSRRSIQHVLKPQQRFVGLAIRRTITSAMHRQPRDTAPGRRIRDRRTRTHIRNRLIMLFRWFRYGACGLPTIWS